MAGLRHSADAGETGAASSPAFSIVTPSFNQSDWLRLCVASVADQSVTHEHLVQDAGSSDGTLDWILTDKRLAAVSEADRGMYDGINRGLKRARGAILAYLNCDEQYTPGALEKVAGYFAAHPDVDVVFADAVVVDTGGRYLWHRKTLVPKRAHTEMFPLSTLTCATFFRRRVVSDLGILFDPDWRFCGDSVWVRELLRCGLRLGVLRHFTSVFTHTGDNLSLRPEVKAEAERYFAEASTLNRCLKPAVLLHHRLRRYLGGIYHQAPFDFSCYTRESLQKGERVTRHVEHPTFRWQWEAQTKQ